MSSNCSLVQCVEDQNKQHFCLVILLLNDASDRQKCLVHPVLNEEFQEKYWFRKSYKLTSCIVWFWVQILQSTSCQRHLTLSKRRLMQLRIQGFKLSTQLWTITKWINNSRASFLMNKVFLPLSHKFFFHFSWHSVLSKKNFKHNNSSQRLDCGCCAGDCPLANLKNLKKNKTTIILCNASLRKYFYKLFQWLSWEKKTCCCWYMGIKGWGVVWYTHECWMCRQ